MTTADALRVYAEVRERWPHSKEVNRDRMLADVAVLQYEHAIAAVETMYHGGREFAPNGAQIRGRVADLALDAPDWGVVKGEIDRRRGAVGGAAWAHGDRVCPDGLCDGSGTIVEEELPDSHAAERDAITAEFLAAHEPASPTPRYSEVLRFVCACGYIGVDAALAAVGAQHLGLDRALVFEFVTAHAAVPEPPLQPRHELRSRHCTCREQMLLDLSAATGIHWLVNEFISVVGRAEIAGLDGDRIAEAQVRKKWEDHVANVRRATVYHGIDSAGLPALERLQNETAVRAGLGAGEPSKQLRRASIAALDEGDR